MLKGGPCRQILYLVPVISKRGYKCFSGVPPGLGSSNGGSKGPDDVILAPVGFQIANKLVQFELASGPWDCA